MGLRSRLAVVVFLVLAVVGTVVGTAKAVPYVTSRVPYVASRVPYVASHVRYAASRGADEVGRLTTDDVGRRFGDAEAERPTRIISLVPAATEMIFAMGDGERVVAVSDYDRFPAGVSRLPKVGGLLDPNVERIISLRPDLVVVYATQKELVQRLERGGIPYFSYEHRGLPDIMTTVRAIGARIGSATHADAVASDMDRSLAGIRTTTARLPHPATLLVFSRDPSSLRNVYASGGYGFLHDMLEIAGGTNVFGEIKRQSVQASTEMLITRRPEVIIELRYGDSVRHADVSKELQVWNVLGSVPAIRNHRVAALVGDEFVVPGPRVVDATRRLARALHPEAFR